MLRKLVSILTHICKDYELCDSLYVVYMLHFFTTSILFKQKSHLLVLWTLVYTKVVGHV